ncbi:MAG: ASKHA domain-containing protein, partial [Chloroflexia bacterium]
MTDCLVTFEPSGRRILGSPGQTLAEAARRAGLPIASTCGGRGTCGQCRVQVRGLLDAPTSQEIALLSPEERQAGYRLACQARLRGPATVVLPLVEPVAYKAVLLRAIPPLEPNVRKVHGRLSPPSLSDQRADLERLREELGLPNLEVAPAALRRLASTLRQAHWDVTAVLVGGRLASVEEGDTRDRAWGVACDLGTTTVAVYLLDLNTGEPRAASVALNRQSVYGDDVLSRLDRAHAGETEALRRAALETLNALIAQACREAGLSREHIYEATLVGNPCMVHLFLGLDPHPIGVAPYIPTVTDPLDLPAREAGLEIAPGANVHILPAVAGYVGADAVADALAASLGEDERVRVLVDLGTNAEVLLSRGGELFACAAAAGPAFEGARISCGMRAAPGAINRVHLADGRVQVHVLGEHPALGLAGSGLVSAAAALRRAGLLSSRGRFLLQDAPPGLFAPGRRGPELVLVPEADSGTGKRLTLTQQDIAELLLAKAAVAAGLHILLQEAGLGESDLVEVLLAGSF